VALTVTQLDDLPVLTGNVVQRRVRLTFDNAYPTGGEAYTADLLGLSVLHRLDVSAVNNQANRLILHDPANLKVKVYTALGAEAANASDQSTITVDAVAIGVGPA
jgi:hypothetical protein